MKLLREELSRRGETLAGVQRRLCKVNQICSGVCDQFIFSVPPVFMLGLLVIVLMFQLISHFQRE